MSRFGDFTAEEWVADPILNKRSITPPRSMVRESIDTIRPVDFAASSKRLEERNEELGGVKAHLLTSSLSRYAAMPDIIRQIDGEVSNNESCIDTLSTKYDTIFSIYHSSLTASSFPIFYKETYTIVAGSSSLEASVAHYRINHDIPVDLTTSTVFGVSTIEMAEDSAKSSDAASSKASSTSGSTKASKKAILLHPLEIELLTVAAHDLVVALDKRAVLLDIFDKDQKTEIGRLKVDKSGKIETHTIVLYKQINESGTQISIIDPNNSTFSKHLDHPIFKACINSVIPSSGWIDIVAATQKPIKIYTSPEGAPIGPEPEHFRDCEDISVKIATWLNRPDIVIPQNLSFESKGHSIIDLPIMRAISNVYETYGDLTELHSKLPLRGRQSSMQDVILEIARLEKFINIQKDLLFGAINKPTLSKKVQSDLKQKVLNNHMSMFEVIAYDTDPEKYMQPLKQVIVFNVSLISDPSVGFMEIMGSTELSGGLDE